MSSLGTADLIVLVVYLGGVVALGIPFRGRSSTPEGFTSASGRLPGWAVGLSLFGTFLSSNTFIGVPGSAFAGNWNAFVFSLSLPFAAWVASRYFVPFYRSRGEISAYSHLERRFGRWARRYTSVCYLLMQLARMGTILFGVAIALSELSGWPIAAIIIGGGLTVTLYTLVGGIEAVIWTDVTQSLVLMAGALFVAVWLVVSLPGGLSEALAVGNEAGKFSLGSPRLDFTESTIWVVLLYGVFINLNNFGIDQSFVQRYHTARTHKDATRALWMAAWMYIPISAVFFFIGTMLFAYYRTFDSGGVTGDAVFPHFIANALPPGVAGVLVAALVAAAMSSIDTSLNSSATVVYEDFFRPADKDRAIPPARAMKILRWSTCAAGLSGTVVALAMIGVSNLLDAWWTLSGVFAGGMLGLFLLGAFGKSARRPDAILAVIAGVLTILWMTVSPRLAGETWPKNALHAQMTTVIGTLSIFVVGSLSARLRRPRSP